MDNVNKPCNVNKPSRVNNNFTSSSKNFKNGKLLRNKEVLPAAFEDNADGCRHVEEFAIPVAEVLGMIAWASEYK